jgi:hypothetical protein
MRLRDQMTRAERDAANRRLRASIGEHDHEIEVKRTEPLLAMFEPDRAANVARLEERRAMLAGQLEVGELSVLRPG